MRRILFTETNLDNLPIPPAGYRYIGFDGPTFSIQSEIGTLPTSVVGPTGPMGPTGSGEPALSEVTYSELVNMIDEDELTTGKFYKITDFKTCYDQPDYDIYKTPIAVSGSSYVATAVDPIVVLAVSENSLALDAFQPSYPNDTIKYDVTYSTTESGNTAFGRITERVDEWGNRADHDHRTIEFKRYRLRTYARRTPLAGTVELQSDGTVLGTLTNFTALSPGQVIAIRNSSETFYEIDTITDDFTMTVTGETITATGAGFQFFDTNSHSYDSYYPNNVDGELDFSLYKTFEAAYDDGCINTYIGDHSKYFLEFGNGDFLLANNVLKDGEYRNNTIGDSSYNNTFNDDCTANQIGYGFRNNITDDDFDENVIGTFFENNIITANFYDNHVGNDFNDNVIINSSFYRNQIGNDFRDNWLDGDWGFEFQNNQIGNQFNNNEIYREFYKNVILNGYNNNQTWSEVYGNKIGNAFNNNEIYNQFYDNQILDYFQNNQIGDLGDIGSYSFYNNVIGNNFKGNASIGNFYGNKIGNDFVSNSTDSNFRDNLISNNFNSNNIGYLFGYNVIGSNFQNNTVGDEFGYGGSQPRGNKIGNNFISNNIGEYFYDNVIVDGFESNTIGYDFQNNDIKVSVTSTDFRSQQGQLLSIIENNFPTPGSADDTYVGSQKSTSGIGQNCTIAVTVVGGNVVSAAINDAGYGYVIGDTITISAAVFGGVDGVDDLVVSVNAATTTTYVTDQTSCTIFNDSSFTKKLSYIDNLGVLNVVSVTTQS